MTATRTIIFDAIAILAFAILARAAHNTDADPFTLANILDTWWPFLIGGGIGHAICAAAKKAPGAIAPGGTIVWLATAATGLGIWAFRHGEAPHWSFIIVATVMSGLLLLGWRAAARAAAARR